MPMSSMAAGTIVAKNYLSYARVMAESFRRHHPDIPFFVVLADEVDGYFDPCRERSTILPLADLGISNLPAFLFGYSRHQTVVAAKPYLLSHLLDLGFRSAIFLDADLLILNDLASLTREVARHAMVLTPHFLGPAQSAPCVDRELNILVSGTYNGGFVGVSDTPATRRFLAWWQERLYKDCRYAVRDGFYYDQRWLDFAPSFVEDLCVLRESCYNVAYWNLPERPVHLEGDAVFVDGIPCKFFHFSGFEPERLPLISRYSARWTLANIGPVAELFRRYAALLAAGEYQQTHNWPYAWDSFDNGASIPALVRELYRGLGAGAARFGNPFRTELPGNYFSWLNEPAQGQFGTPAVTRLWKAVYDRRPDVQAAYPDIAVSDRQRFAAWARHFGAAEHSIPPPFLCAI